MRRITLLWVAIFAACDSLPADVSTAAGDELSRPSSAREVLIGSVGVQTFDDDVIVSLDGGPNPAQPDGVADRVFVLQRKGPVDAIAPEQLKRARLVVSPSEVEIVSFEGVRVLRLLLQTDGTVGPTNVRDRGWPTAVGYGLSRRSGAWALSAGALDAAQIKDVSAGCGRVVDESGARTASPFAFCWSGGAGATSCTTPCTGGRACSVGCATGSYACCDNTLCRCTCVAADKLPVSS
jgi:hypothetical protein